MTSHHAATRPGLTLLVRPYGASAVQLHDGASNLELAVPIDNGTVFNVGSVAKQVTAHLVLRAAREGQLSLSRRITDLLPRFRIPDVTVADLLLHHGGVRDAESLLSLAGFRDLDHYTSDDLLALAYRQIRRAVPAGHFLYSNTGYLLLAEILRTVQGAALQDLASEQLFAPLGMASTRFKSDPRQIVPAAASAYRPTPDGWEHCARPAALPGSGSLWSTVTDLDRWLSYVHTAWLQNPDADLPFSAELSYRNSDNPFYVYGAGLYADVRPERGAVFHHGHEQGFSATSFLARTGMHVICLSNHASIQADHIATTFIDAIRLNPRLDLTVAAFEALDIDSIKQGFTEVSTNRRGDVLQTFLGAYTCDQVPGELRLACADGDLYLWRRGTCDHLVKIGPRAYRGNGYTIALPVQVEKVTECEGFTLNLNRAPGLRYFRQRPRP